MLIYRMLPAQEWNKLGDLYFTLFPDAQLPTPETASVAVAEDEDGVVRGFWFFQMAAHLEPAGIDPSLSGEVSLHILRDTIHKALSNFPGMEYYLYTAAPEWDEALQTAGFIPIGVAYKSAVPTEN